MAHTVQGMTVALENNERISIHDVPLDFDQRHEHTYICPVCQGIVYAKKGAQVAHHFAHKSSTRKCDNWNADIDVFKRSISSRKSKNLFL